MLRKVSATAVRKLVAELVGTTLLLAAVVGSGIMGERLSGAYWFTASTSFANPAVAIARTLTDTFTGIRPADALGVIVAQCVGGAVATALFRWLVPSLPQTADHVVFANGRGRP